MLRGLLPSRKITRVPPPRGTQGLQDKGATQEAHDSSLVVHFERAPALEKRWDSGRIPADSMGFQGGEHGFRGIPWCKTLGFCDNQPGWNSLLYNIKEEPLLNTASRIAATTSPQAVPGRCRNALKFYRGAPFFPIILAGCSDSLSILGTSVRCGASLCPPAPCPHPSSMLIFPRPRPPSRPFRLPPQAFEG